MPRFRDVRCVSVGVRRSLKTFIENLIDQVFILSIFQYIRVNYGTLTESHDNPMITIADPTRCGPVVGFQSY